MTVIILLNWNGYKDTIACLESLFQMKCSDYFIIVVDNGSEDDSLKEISEWLNVRNHNNCLINEGKEDFVNIENKSVIIYSLKENYGFSKGNNIGIELAKKYAPAYYLLLNNDTIVEKYFLARLTEFQNENPQYKILTPLILYYDDPQLIWNAGGQLIGGFRKCYYDNKHIRVLSGKDCLNISFLTGCALFFHNCLLNKGPLLTEDFFFGEEDFNFCIQMKRNNIRMCCLLSSVIYHKVSASTSSIGSCNKIYLYYLNRFIDIKKNYNSVFYFLWKCISIPYMILLLLRLRYTVVQIFFLIKRLLSESKKMDSVSKEMFLRIMFTDFNIKP